MKNLKEAGQMTIEMILIMILLISVALSLSNFAKDRGFAASMVEGPWTVVQGMIESGVWKKAPDAKNYHPNLLSRHASERGNAL